MAPPASPARIPSRDRAWFQAIFLVLRSLPTGELLDADGLVEAGEAMRATFEQAGVDLERPLIATCGSGITACNILFGAALIGKTDVTHL